MIMSLRMRFIIGVVFSVAVLLCIAGIMIYSATRLMLITNFDKSLLNTARLLSAIVEDESYDIEHKDHEDINVPTASEEKIEFDLNLNAMPEFSTPFGGAYFQFWNMAGISIIRSPSLKDASLSRFENMSQTAQYQEIILPDGNKGREIAFEFTPKTEAGEDKATFSIVVARDASAIFKHLAFLKKLMLITIAAVILLSIFAATFVTGAGLKPIHRLADEISTVDIKNLNKNHISKKYPKELSPVTKCLNSLLARLKISFEREKQFNSDVAHELRTPLAGIKSTIEVSLSRDRKPEEYKASLVDCLNVANSMHRMINSLLSLARFESQQQTLNYEEVILKNLIDQCWISFEDRANDRKITFQNRIKEDIICACDKTCLSMVVSNILDNAVEHSNTKEKIWAEGQKLHDHILISISNTGCKLDQKQIGKVFNSFWTADASRQNAGRHCGIGLTVVKRVVEILNGNVGALVSSDKIFTINITLPTKVKISS